MTIIIEFILGFIAFVLLLLLSIAAVSHHCNGCGEMLVRSAGSRWRCPKCGRIYTISVLGLGQMRQVAFSSQDDESMVKAIRAFFSVIKDKAQELIIRIKCFLLGHKVERQRRREVYRFRTNRKGKTKKRYYSYIHKCTTDYCQRCGKVLRRKWKWI